MEYWLLTSLLIFTASLISLFSAALKHSNHEELEELSQTNKKAAKLFNLRLKLDEQAELFSPLEILIYICAVVFASPAVYSDSQLTLIYFALFVFTQIILFRTIFQALGSRYDIKILIPLSFLAVFLYYVNIPFISITKFIRTFLRGESQEEISRGELSAMVDSAHEEGSIDQDEYKILKNIMNFSEVIVSDVMTPRTVVFSLPANKTIEEVINFPELQMYSRIPVWQGESIDDSVIGYVMTKDILQNAIKSNLKTKLSEISREIYFIPENAELDIALDKFLKRRQHIFLVVDEYGGVEGLLTMEDVMETILGAEIVDEADRVVDLREFAKTRRDHRIANIKNS